MALNVPVRVVPTTVTAVMITTAINEAIRPYSMAVTPDSSLAKRAKRVFMSVILGSRFKQCLVGTCGPVLVLGEQTATDIYKLRQSKHRFNILLKIFNKKLTRPEAIADCLRRSNRDIRPGALEDGHAGVARDGAEPSAGIARMARKFAAPPRIAAPRGIAHEDGRERRALPPSGLRFPARSPDGAEARLRAGAQSGAGQVELY
jgi:hypothetical protein